MKKRACIFDFDGTIIDSMDEFADIASGVLNRHFGTPLNEARRQYFETSGLPFCEQIELLHSNDPRNAAAVSEYETTKKKTYLGKRPFDDVEETIRYLKNKGIKTIVSSNNFQDLVDELIKKTEIKFDMVLGFRKNFAKGRDHFEYAQREMKCKPEEMIFIGDSLKDASLSSDCGIDFIAKTGTFSKDDFKRGKVIPLAIINSLKELKAFFEECL